jgi:hypothetical protein
VTGLPARTFSTPITAVCTEPLAGAVECVSLVVVDDEKLAVFRLNTVWIRRLSFIQQQPAFPRRSVVVRHERRHVRAFSVWRVVPHHQSSRAGSHRPRIVGSGRWEPALLHSGFQPANEESFVGERSALQVGRSVTPRSVAIGGDALCDSARISQQHPQAAVTTLDDHVLIDSCAVNADLTDAFERLALIRPSLKGYGVIRGNFRPTWYDVSEQYSRMRRIHVIGAQRPIISRAASGT